MSDILHASVRATKSLTHWRLFRIFVASIALNAVILAGMVFLIHWGLRSFSLFGWWDWLADYGLSFFSAALAYFIFPILLPLIISFFDTAITDIIEKEEYPEVPTPQPPFWPTLAQDVRFTLKALGLDALFLPLYFLPGVNIALYYMLNGYLLGTEFFNVVAGRHIDPAEAQNLRRKNRVSVVLCGGAIAFCATIPFLNLITPIWGVVLMVHYFHSLKPSYKMTQSDPL